MPGGGELWSSSPHCEKRADNDRGGVAPLEVGNGGAHGGAHADRVVDNRDPLAAERSPQRRRNPVVDREEARSLTEAPFREGELHAEL